MAAMKHKISPAKQQTYPIRFYTQDEASAQFLEPFRISSDTGGNCHAREFDIVTRHLMNTCRSFCFSDLVRECKNFSIEFAEAKYLFFEHFLPLMLKLSKIEIIEGVMDEPTYLVTG